MLDSFVSFRFLSLLLGALAFTSWPLLVQAQTNTTAPSPGPNECDQLEAGDVYFTYVRSLDPNSVVMFLLDDIPGNMKLYLTDNAWTGTGFQVDEGTLEVSASYPSRLLHPSSLDKRTINAYPKMAQAKYCSCS